MRGVGGAPKHSVPGVDVEEPPKIPEGEENIDAGPELNKKINQGFEWFRGTGTYSKWSAIGIILDI